MYGFFNGIPILMVYIFYLIIQWLLSLIIMVKIPNQVLMEIKTLLTLKRYISSHWIEIFCKLNSSDKYQYLKFMGNKKG